MRSSKSKKNYHHGDLYEACIATAAAKIKKFGPESLSFRDLARDLKVSVAAPYRHFSSKQELFAAIACQGHKDLTLLLIKAADGSNKEPLQLLESLGLAYFKFAIEDKSRYWLMFGRIPLNRNEFDDLRAAEDNTFETFSSILKHLLNTSGKANLNPSQLEPLALSIWSTMHGFISLYLDNKLVARQMTVAKAKESIRFIAYQMAQSLIYTLKFSH